MVKFTPEMKEALRVPGKGGSLIYLCTSSRGGNPNIAAMRFVATHMDDKILIADMFLLKTKANIKENPNVAVTICHPLDEGAGGSSGAKPWIWSTGSRAISTGTARTRRIS